MLELAKDCKHLLVFIHVSTAYVNCTRKGNIEEKIYDLDIDIENFVSRVMKMP